VVSDVWGLALGLVTVVLGVTAFCSLSVPPPLDLLPPILSAKWRSREAGSAVER
jgi:hypothetical protein